MKALYKVLEVVQVISTAYHLQIDGSTERFNQEIELYLSIYCATNPQNWLKILSIVEYVHNSHLYTGRTNTLFKLIIGYLTKIFSAVEETQPEDINHRLKIIEEECTQVKKAYAFTKNIIDQHIKIKIPEIKIEAKVWLSAKNICTKHPIQKFMPKQFRLFKVLEKQSLVNYRLALPLQWKIYPIFHIHLLWPVEENTQYGPFDKKPSLELIEEKNE